MADQIYKVSDISKYIHDLFIADYNLRNIVICGEISGFKISREHAYFNLKDSTSAIQCSCFNYKKTYVPKEGEQVLAKGSIDYYQPNGKLSFNIYHMEPYGIGALAALFEKLKKELSDKGYFDEAHKKPIPKFPKRICVITSKTGAVIRDIITTTRKNNDLIDIVIKDCKVQGVGADEELALSIEEVDKLNYDVIIVARGGGSLEDLMPFNSEKIVYAIYNAKTPIISAVGHETDFTLCDFVSDYRAATPTAAAEVVAYDVMAYKEYIQNGQIRLLNSLNNILNNSILKLDTAQKRLTGALNAIYSKNRAKLDVFSGKIPYLAENILKNKELLFKALAARLDAINPSKVFTTGYMYALKNDGQNVKNINDINVGDNIKLITQGGSATANIIEVKNEI